jgi:hypothetical protein
MELLKCVLGVQEVPLSVLETSPGSTFRIFSALQVNVRIVSNPLYCSLSNSPCRPIVMFPFDKYESLIGTL